MGTLPKGGSDSSGEIHLQLPEKDGGSSSYLVDHGSPVSIGSSLASSSHHSSLRELEREIAEALQRRHSDSRRPWLFHPDVVPYYHTAMSLLCVLIMCATAPKYLAPDYPLPGYLVNGNMTYSSTVFYLDVIFAAMGLPLGSDLFIDVVSHFVASDGDTNDINKRLQLSAKAKEWTLRFQFIVAFSLTSVARLACGIKDPARLVVLMYLTQFLRTVIICVYGMFSYTNTFDTEPWQYLRSLAVSAMFIVSHMLIYYGSLVERTPVVTAYVILGKILILAVSNAYLYLCGVQFHRMWRKAVLAGGLAALTTNELCFTIYATCIIAGMLEVFLFMMPGQMELYNMGDASYVTHAVMMVTHALAVTSLPVRIARSEVRRAKGLVLLAQQSVSDTIELQLRHLIVEMDGLLHSANFLHLLTRDELLRLKRIVGLCNDVTASLEDIADADLTSHSAESVGSSLERLLEGHDRAAAATAAAGGGGTLRCRNRPSLRVSFNLPVGDDTDHDGCGSSVNGVADGSAMRSRASSGAMSSVTAPGSAAAAEDNPPNIDALHIRGVSAAMRRSLRHAHRKAAKSWIQVDGDAMGEGMDARLRLLSSSLRQESHQERSTANERLAQDRDRQETHDEGEGQGGLGLGHHRAGAEAV